MEKNYIEIPRWGVDNGTEQITDNDIYSIYQNAGKTNNAINRTRIALYGEEYPDGKNKEEWLRLRKLIITHSYITDLIVYITYDGKAQVFAQCVDGLVEIKEKP